MTPPRSRPAAAGPAPDYTAVRLLRTDVEQVSRNGRADRDVALSNRLDQVLGLCDDTGQIHAEEVEPLTRAMLNDVADASINPAEQSVELTSFGRSCRRCLLAFASTSRTSILRYGTKEMARSHRLIQR